MSSDRQLNYVNDLQNRDQKLYYVDDASELNSINLKENDKIYAINDNKLFQMEIADQEEELSGSIVSFNGRNNTKIKSLVANIEPQQDLHGYDNPWPGGGGKNKLPMTFDVIKAENINGAWSGNTFTRNGLTFTVNVDSDGNITGITVNGTASATTNFRLNSKSSNAFLVADTAYTMNGCPSGGGDLTFGLSTTDNITTTYKDVGSGTTFTPSSALIGNNYISVIYVNSGVQLSNALFKPMIRLATETDSTFAPYSNICPISGWTGAEILHTGKNIFGGTLLRDGIKASMPSATVDEDEKTVQFNALATVRQNITKKSGLSNRFKENTRYTFLMTYVKTSGEVFSNLRIYYTDGSYTTIASLDDASVKQTTVTVSAAGKTIFGLSKTNASGITKVYYDESGVFEGVLTATDFVPYTGNTISVNWETEAGTVYGGKVTLNEDGSVDVVAEFAKRTIKAVGGSFGATNNGYAYYVSFAGTNHTVPYAKQSNMRSNRFKYYPSSRADAPLYSYGGTDGANTTLFFILPSTIMTVADANAWFTSNPIDITIYLATPQTYHIPNIGELRTYLGTNNIWSSTGDITVKIAEKGITAFELAPHT